MPIIGELSVKFSGDATPIKNAAGEAARASEEAARRAQKASQELYRALETMGGGIRNIGMAITASVTLPMALMGKSSLDAAAKMQSLDASMTSIMGSSEAAKKQLAALEGMSKRTATAYDSLVKASLGVTAGFDGDAAAANRVLEQFSTLSNVMNLSKADFDRLAVNITQVSGASSLAGDELRQMAELLPSLRPMLKEAFGTASSEEIAKMGVSGKKALEEIARVIKDSGMVANTKTYNALLIQLQTQFFKLKVAVGQAILPIATAFAEKLVPAVEQFAKAISEMTPEQKEMALRFAAIVAAIGPLLIALGTGISMFAKFQMVTLPALKTIGAAFANAGGMAGLLGKAITLLSGPVGWIIAAAALIYAAWVNNFGGIRDKVLPLVQEIQTWIETRWRDIASATETLRDVVVELWSNIAEKLEPVIEFIEIAFGKAIGDIVDKWTTAWRVISGAFDLAIVGINAMAGKGMENVSAAVKAGAARASSAIYGFVANSIEAFNALLQRATAVGKAISGVLGTKVLEATVPNLDSAVKYWRLMESTAGKVAVNFQKAADAELAAERARRKNEEAKLKEDSGWGTGFNITPKGTVKGKAGERPLDVKSSIEKELEQIAKLGERTMAKMREELSVMGDTKEANEGFREMNGTLSEMLNWLGLTHGEWAKMKMVVTETGATMQEKLIKKFSDVKGAAQKLFDLKTTKEYWNGFSASIIATANEIGTRVKAFVDARQKDFARMISGYKQELFFLKEVNELKRLEYRLNEGDLAANAFTDEQKKAILAAAYNVELEKTRQKLPEIVAQIFKWVNGVSLINNSTQASEAYSEFMANLATRVRLLGANSEYARLQIQLLRQGMTEEEARNAATFQLQVERIEEWQDRMKKLTEKISGFFGDMLDDLLKNGFNNFFGNVLAGFRNMLQQIALEYLKSQITGLISRLVGGFFSRMGGGPNIDAFTSSLGLAPRAAGGSVYPGMEYLVGERGPEMFVPKESGRIVSNDKLADRGGITVVMNVQGVNDVADFVRSKNHVAAKISDAIRASRAAEGF